MLPTASIERIQKFFDEHHISLKLDWLRCAIGYACTQTGSDNIHPSVIYELWKYSDIKESTNPCIIASTVSNNEFNGIMVLQIQAITDIGTSYLSQFKKLVYVATDNAEFQSTNMQENAEKETGSRLLQLLLSDGVTQIKAVEYVRVDQFSLLVCPGSKVIIHGNIRVRRDVFLLKPENCQLLGGDVESLMRTNRPVEIMAVKLKLPVPKKPLEQQLQQRSSSPQRQTDVMPNNVSDSNSNGRATDGSLHLSRRIPDSMDIKADIPAQSKKPSFGVQAQIQRRPSSPPSALLVEVEQENYNLVDDSVETPIRVKRQPDSMLVNPAVPMPKRSLLEQQRTPQQQQSEFALSDCEILEDSAFSHLHASNGERSSSVSISKRPVIQPLEIRKPPPVATMAPTQPASMQTPKHPAPSQIPTVPQQDTTPVRDAEAHFADYIASLLREMPPAKRNEKRAKIFAILNSD